MNKFKLIFILQCIIYSATGYAVNNPAYCDFYGNTDLVGDRVPDYKKDKKENNAYKKYVDTKLDHKEIATLFSHISSACNAKSTPAPNVKSLYSNAAVVCKNTDNGSIAKCRSLYYQFHTHTGNFANTNITDQETWCGYRNKSKPSDIKEIMQDLTEARKQCMYSQFTYYNIVLSAESTLCKSDPMAPACTFVTDRLYIAKPEWY